MRRSRSFPVLCDDGRVRRATWAAASADTFFSRRARVSVNGRTVSGFAYAASDFTIARAVREDIGVTHRAVSLPASAADLFYADAPTVRSGIMRFAATGRNADVIARA
jgi:hypothetical protein